MKQTARIQLISLLSVGLTLLPSFVFAIDTDDDGLEDEKEVIYYTDANNPDTDGDGFFDGIEIQKGYSPLAASNIKMHEHDLDGDGLNDWLEVWFHSDMSVKDTDGDGRDDFVEVMGGFDPASPQAEKKFKQEIIVNRTDQHMSFYVDGVKIKKYPVSTGNPVTSTPAGSFSIQKKIPMKRYVGADYDLPNTPWNMQFKPSYYIHAAYWHNFFGKRTRSHGCVNMKTEDAKELYSFVDVGVSVTVTGTTPVRFWVGA